MLETLKVTLESLDVTLQSLHTRLLCRFFTSPLHQHAFLLSMEIALDPLDQPIPLLNHQSQLLDFTPLSVPLTLERLHYGREFTFQTVENLGLWVVS